MWAGRTGRRSLIQSLEESFTTDYSGFHPCVSWNTSSPELLPVFTDSHNDKFNTVLCDYLPFSTLEPVCDDKRAFFNRDMSSQHHRHQARRPSSDFERITTVCRLWKQLPDLTLADTLSCLHSHSVTCCFKISRLCIDQMSQLCPCFWCRLITVNLCYNVSPHAIITFTSSHLIWFGPVAPLLTSLNINPEARRPSTLQREHRTAVRMSPQRSEAESRDCMHHFGHVSKTTRENEDVRLRAAAYETKWCVWVWRLARAVYRMTKQEQRCD